MKKKMKKKVELVDKSIHWTGLSGGNYALNIRTVQLGAWESRKA